MNEIAPLSDVTIEPKQGGKGRAFRATALAYATADKLWPGGETDTGDVARPVYATFLGSDDELRPFVANVMAGRRALSGDRNKRASGFEFLRTAGYRCAWQREPEGSLVTVYLPDLFLMDPGMVDPKEAKFVLLPPKTWAAAQRGIPAGEIARHARRLPLVKELNTPPEWQPWQEEQNFKEPFPVERLAEMAPTAYLFAAYLDRRTRAPLPNDGRFYLQVMLACLGAGMAETSRPAGYYNDYHASAAEKFGRAGLGFAAVGTDAAGFLPGVAFRAGHEALEALLAEEIAEFFKLTKGR